MNRRYMRLKSSVLATECGIFRNVSCWIKLAILKYHFCFFTVMRTQGSLRVVLNTKLWPSMTLEKGNEKSLRITAMDSENNIKIYLIMVRKFSVGTLAFTLL